MTTDEIMEQARADMAQLDIGQLRCGVLLQLLHIEALKKERDEWLARHAECCRLMGECMQDRADMGTERDALALGVEQWIVDFHELRLEHDALMSAAKLAWVAIVELRYSSSTDKSRSVSEFAVQALREAGVQ